VLLAEAAAGAGDHGNSIPEVDHVALSSIVSSPLR